MRFFIILAIILPLASGFKSQTTEKGKAPARYGIDSDTRGYPQNSPKETLGSALKAVGDGRIDYMLAQLADPMFVDKRVEFYMEKLDPALKEPQKRSLAFDQLVQATAKHFQDDPSKLRELHRFLDEADWQESGDDAVARLKGLTARAVFMKRLAPERWVMLDKEK